MGELENNSSYDEDIEVKSEYDLPEMEISIEEIKVEENDLFCEDYIHYEYLNDSPNSQSDVTHENPGSISQSKVASRKRKRCYPHKYPKPDSPIPTYDKSGVGLKPNDKYELSDTGPLSQTTLPLSASTFQSDLIIKDESNDEFENQGIARESVRSADSPEKLKEPVILPKLHANHESDPDFIPANQKTKRSASVLHKPKDVIYDRMYLKNYKRTACQDDCIFKFCTLKDTALIPNNIRMKLLHEYKLYVLRSSKACSIHMRDQNWNELLKYTYNDFTASDIEDLLNLLKQASMVLFDFDNIETIPTRFIRYWMNVNKVQFKRIYDSFPALQDLKSPKTALAVYLMYLQQEDVERIALLMQAPVVDIRDKIKSVQAIVTFQNYDEMNDMFQLEY